MSKAAKSYKKDRCSYCSLVLEKSEINRFHMNLWYNIRKKKISKGIFSIMYTEQEILSFKNRIEQLEQENKTLHETVEFLTRKL